MNATAAALPITGFRSRLEAVGGVRLHYWLGGDAAGQPIILWHGFLSTGYAWREVATALAEAGMCVLVPDMRGYGDSDKPDGNEGYDARALSEECRSLVAQLGFGGGKPVIHAAHDMGALPALIWAADHPREVTALLYIEAPVMLGDVLRKIIAYTPEAMEKGSMWWWILPLAPGVPEALIVGNERAFLHWFYQGSVTVHQEVFTPAVINEYLRTFSGREGVLGSFGIYRAAFTSIAQTEPLMKRRIAVPVVALGGVNGLGSKVGEMVAMVAENVEAHTLTDCGHFMPEERPDVVVNHILSVAAKINTPTNARKASVGQFAKGAVMGKLENKVAVITGGSSGMALATAKLFVEEGAHVFITGRRQEALDEAVKTIGRKVTGVQGDAANLDDLDRLYDTVRRDKGNIDVLFASAGIGGEARRLGQITEKDFDSIFSLNTRGTLFTVQKALPLFNDGGSIIMTGSIASNKGWPDYSVYSGSKAALHSFARTWLNELKDRRIRVNVLSPGQIATPIQERMFDEATKRQFEALIPRGKMGRPEEIATVALFLASDDSSYVNGVELAVDGGTSAI